MGFKRKIIKVMVGGKKSKKLNLKEIFRSANRDQNMSKSYEKEDSRKTRRQETCLCVQQISALLGVGIQTRRKKQKNKANKYRT